MTESNSTVQPIDWLSRPLCGSYFLVIHESIPIQLLDRAPARDQIVCWALGVLADGGYEVLGVWPASSSGAWCEEEVTDDLKARGVEKIRFISALGVGTGLGVPRGRGRTVLAGEEVMRRLQRHARRAISRRGPFFDVAEASAFLVSVLSRAEQSIAAAGASVHLAVRSLAGTGQRRSLSKRGTVPAAGH